MRAPRDLSCTTGRHSVAFLRSRGGPCVSRDRRAFATRRRSSDRRGLLPPKSGFWPEPIDPRRWVCRAPLAPNVRSRSMCSALQPGCRGLEVRDWRIAERGPQSLIPNASSFTRALDPPSFVCSPRSCGLASRDAPPLHTQIASSASMAVVAINLPTEDAISLERSMAC